MLTPCERHVARRARHSLAQRAWKAARFSRWSRRDRVGFKPTSEFRLRYWPSVLREIMFLQVPGTGAA